MTLSKSDIEKLGRAYLNGLDESHTAKARSMARAHADRVERDFRKLTKRIRVEFVDRDPYKSFAELQADVVGNRRMFVFTGSSDTPLWSPEINWKSRAVHDFDHVIANTDFSIPGEIRAYQQAVSGGAEGLDPLYLSEIALQAASTEVLGKFAEGPQKLVFVDEDVAKIARRFRRNPGLRDHVTPKRTKRNARAVWDAAGALRAMTPIQLIRRLGQNGMPFPDALVLVDAAMRVR